ncbi:alpha/beta hydrolase [Mycobacterium angelicum]|nr:alpha/beta hydrolase [Mycobacterium angelicum]
MHEFARAAQQLNAISDDFPLTAGQGRTAQLEMPQLPPDGATTQDVENWWNSLSQEDKERLIAAHPQKLGILNGIPAAVRDPVNRAVLNDDLHRVQDLAKLNGVDPSAVVSDPAKYGLTADDITRYTNAIQTRNGLEHDRTWTADGQNNGDRPVMLWAYDPLAFQGRGKAAIAIGNPDWARNTAVIVPGTGSSVKAGWLAGGRNDAAVLYDQSRLADPDSTSVIAWMGYETPDSFGDPDIGNTTLARQGGNLLAADVNGLTVTHNGPANITVIGHSYGSTTVADAFANSGMHANNAILLGCPGTDLARSAADFHLPDGGHVYVGAASTDPISWVPELGSTLQNYLNDELGNLVGASAGLGSDPAADSFGSIRFRAEVPGADGLNPSDHSYYYTVGSESLRSMTDIVSGNPGRLIDDNLIAEGRHLPHLTTPSQVNIPGLGRVEIPHIDIPLPGLGGIDIEPETGRGGVGSNHEYVPK